MNRMFAAVLTVSLVVGAGSTSWGQNAPSVDGGFGGNYVEHYPGFVYGPQGTRWTAYYANPYMIPVQPAPPLVVQVAPEQPRVFVRGFNQAPPTYRRPLRRSWAATPDFMPPSGYLPMMRQQTYGWSYGVGPYGTDYYSGMYKGYYIP